MKKNFLFALVTAPIESFLGKKVTKTLKYVAGDPNLVKDGEIFIGVIKTSDDSDPTEGGGKKGSSELPENPVVTSTVPCIATKVNGILIPICDLSFAALTFFEQGVLPASGIFLDPVPRPSGGLPGGPR